MAAMTAARYVSWLERHGPAIVIATAAAVAASIYLAAFHLPLHADLSDLQPRDPRLRARVPDRRGDLRGGRACAGPGDLRTGFQMRISGRSSVECEVPARLRSQRH